MQGPTRGLGNIQFHDYNNIFTKFELPNVKIFHEQIGKFKYLLGQATPDADQQRDTDFSMAIAELFALIVYAQLVLENVKIHNIDDQTLDQIFDFMVRDFSMYALQLYSKSSTTPRQMEFCTQMIRKPAYDATRYQTVWETIQGLKDLYVMSP